MILVGIDIGKLSHMFCVMDSSTGEFLVNPISFKNNKQGFDSFMDSINSFSKKDVLIGMEDTGHYHFNLLKFLLDSGYAVALINPITTDMTRKMQLGATKDDDLDARLICDVLASNQRRKGYRISKIDSFDLYEQKRLTREHHDLKEQLNVYTNKLQKCIDIVFPFFISVRLWFVVFSAHPSFVFSAPMQGDPCRLLLCLFDMISGRRSPLRPFHAYFR